VRVHSIFPCVSDGDLMTKTRTARPRTNHDHAESSIREQIASIPSMRRVASFARCRLLRELGSSWRDSTPVNVDPLGE
jgi:hypothetical protein